MNVADSLLGKAVTYRSSYSPELLFPIARQQGRARLGIGDTLPFVGCDIWNAWELSWLNSQGMPQVAVASFILDCHSPNIIESKSFKLYLNSLAQTRQADMHALQETLRRDLSERTDSEVLVELHSLAHVAALSIEPLQGQSLDSQDLVIDPCSGPEPDLLACDRSNVVEETLTSDLFRSNCPVTGQPDWASIQISYRGPRMSHPGLLRYLVSFREHSGFHEQCVEHIFSDIRHRCGPDRLEVYARFTRRGGLDINPWRSTHVARPPGNPRSARQ